MESHSFTAGRLHGDVYHAPGSETVIYIPEPEPVTEEVSFLAEELSLTLVAVGGMDWNGDLSPWKAPKVFQGESDFSGGADRFTDELVRDFFPRAEEGLTVRRRMMAGISMSGLFALYMAVKSDRLDAVASISGSLWFDGFADFMNEHSVNERVKRVYVSLGDREKKTKNPRMARVETASLAIQNRLAERGLETVFQMNRGNHFVHGAERLEEAIRYLATGKVWKGPHSL